MTQRLVIIGAGMAAGRVLDHLTDAGGDWDITLFNAEPRGTYNRIMLSPVLSGEKSFDEIVTHDDAWYADKGVTTKFGVKVTKIDSAAQIVRGDDGSEVAYDKLVFATGSNPFIIPMPGHDLDGVVAYRDLEDTEAMMALREGQKAVVIGGGLLGLEAAAGMAARGVDVTVVHLMGHLMERQLDEAAGYLLRKALVDKGITDQMLGQFQANSGRQRQGQSACMLDDGTELPCDLLVHGRRHPPLHCVGAGKRSGRWVEASMWMTRCVTSVENIYAVGRMCRA